jgi:hypothetical protein
MRLIFCYWDPDIDGASPRIQEQRPDNVQIDIEKGEWEYITDNQEDPGFQKKFPIGGGECGHQYRKVSPWGRFVEGCFLVIDAENLVHIEGMANTFLHFGTQMNKQTRIP